jgi:hypothetical protein
MMFGRNLQHQPVRRCSLERGMLLDHTYACFNPSNIVSPNSKGSCETRVQNQHLTSSTFELLVTVMSVGGGGADNLPAAIQCSDSLVSGGRGGRQRAPYAERDLRGAGRFTINPLTCVCVTMAASRRCQLSALLTSAADTHALHWRRCLFEPQHYLQSTII